jgi:hypothetical protein
MSKTIIMTWNKNLLVMPACVSLLILVSCNREPDFEQLKSEIINLHNAAVQAHINKDVDFFTRDLAPAYFSVSNGEIRHPTMNAISSQFSNYLNNTEFEEYTDLEEPLIGFSKDGSLAWSIVKVKVAGRRAFEQDSVRSFNDTWAWITLYKREGGKWLRMGEVSSHD